MRRILFLILIAGLAIAENATDAFDRCLDDCCHAGNGSLNGRYCELKDYAAYDSCVDRCTAEFYDNIDYSYSCCGPAFILIGLAVFSFKN